MIYALCIIGLLVLSALLYIFVTGGVAMIVCAVEDNDDDLDLVIFIAWLIGCILFVFLVIEWATVKCPFFIGGFIGK